ncbi:hypothetical protein BT69DRAFT_1286547 [Atractiella rhizophila]|nr:hypothetical protein BT69DRAFT_1286547 [Atractiella rhizophila]
MFFALLPSVGLASLSVALSVPVSYSKLSTFEPESPSVPKSSLTWTSLRDESLVNWNGGWNDSTSPCNASDISRFAQGTNNSSTSMKAVFNVQEGHGLYISLRASIHTKYRFGFAPSLYIGSSTAGTPEEDETCADGVAFENNAPGVGSVLVEIVGYGSAADSEMLQPRQDQTPFWLKVDGIWRYDLPKSSDTSTSSAALSRRLAVPTCYTIAALIVWFYSFT